MSNIDESKILTYNVVIDKFITALESLCRNIATEDSPGGFVIPESFISKKVSEESKNGQRHPGGWVKCWEPYGSGTNEDYPYDYGIAYNCATGVKHGSMKYTKVVNRVGIEVDEYGIPVKPEEKIDIYSKIILKSELLTVFSANGLNITDRLNNLISVSTAYHMVYILKEFMFDNIHLYISPDIPELMYIIRLTGNYKYNDRIIPTDFDTIHDQYQKLQDFFDDLLRSMLIVRNIHISYYDVKVTYNNLQNTSTLPNPAPGLTEAEKETLYKRLEEGGWI